MFRTVMSLFTGAAALALAALPAAAHELPSSPHPGGIEVWKPYVIEKNCVEDFHECKVRMDYAPFQRAMVARPGSYWYQEPFQHYHYYDHRHRHRVVLRLDHHPHRGASAHVAWCRAHYRTYDPATDTFIGRHHRHIRCDSPYDGR